MKKFFAVFLVIFLLAACAGGRSDSEPKTIREAVIHLDGMELIRIEIDSYDILSQCLVVIHSGGTTYITSPANVVIIEYNLEQLEKLEITPDIPDSNVYTTTGRGD